MAVAIEAKVTGAGLPDPGQVIAPAVERAMTIATALLERETKIRTPIGVTEVARGSIGSEIRRGGSIERGVDLRAELGSPIAYVDVLERGRRPGSPPPADALELWVRRRLGIADPREARSVAFLIARAIGRRGTKAVQMFSRALDENAERVYQIFEDAGLEVVIRLATDRL